MTIQHARLTSSPIGVAVADTPVALSQITAPQHSAAVWQRQPLASFQSWLDGLDPTHLPQARLILRPEAVNDAIAHVCQHAGTPDGPERGMLAGDIAALAHIFSEIVSCDYLRVRLLVGDELPDFSQDSYERNTRLICIYRGPSLTIGRTAPENAGDVSVSNGVPFILDQDSANDVGPKSLRCQPSKKAPATSFFLTLDPVHVAESTRDLHARTYH